MPRSMQKRGSGDGRKAVQRPGRGRAARGGTDPNSVTRVTRETEVRGRRAAIRS